MPYVEKQSTLLYTTESGLTIGIYAEEYTAMDLDLLKRSVAELREQGAELIVYAVHWGAEGHYYPQDHQIEYAHQVIDAGVDIIYGSHPHVLQHITCLWIYKLLPAWSSLGLRLSAPVSLLPFICCVLLSLFPRWPLKYLSVELQPLFLSHQSKALGLPA